MHFIKKLAKEKKYYMLLNEGVLVSNVMPVLALLLPRAQIALSDAVFPSLPSFRNRLISYFSCSLVCDHHSKFSLVHMLSRVFKTLKSFAHIVVCL